MAVTTEHFHNGNASTTSFAYTFPYYKTSDIKVKVGGTLKTESTHYNVTGTNIVFTSGNVPPSGTGNVHIYRETDVDTSKATFAAGSSIRATDLNNNEIQLLYHAQEQNFNKIQTADIQDGGITSSKIATGTIAAADIADNAITSAKIAAGAVETTDLAGSAVTNAKLANNAVGTGNIVDDAVTSAKIATGAVVADGLASNAVTTAKIATGAVTADEIANDAITAAKIADDAVTNAVMAADAVRTVHILDSNVTTAKIANDAVTVDKLADNAVDSQHYVDGSIETVHLEDNSVTGAKLANNTVTDAKLAAGAIGSDKIADAAVATDKIANVAVTTAKIANNAINADKIAANAVSSSEIANDSVTGDHIADDSIASNHYVDGSIGRSHLGADIVDGTKIADNSVGASHIAANAVNGTHISDDVVDSEHYVAGSIDTEHIGDNQVTSAKLGANSVGTTKIAGSAVTHDKLANNAVETGNIVDANVTTAKIADNAVTVGKISDAELTTLAGMPSATASILASSTALTSTTAELNLLDGKSVVTSVSGSSTDVQLPTAKAVNDAVSALNIDNGNFVPINDDQSFPNTHPDPGSNAGTIVSIADAGGLVVNNSGVSTTGRTLGGSTVTINGIDSSLNNTTIAAGKGMLVQTTSTLNTYDYHRLTLDEGGVASAQTLVSDFNQRYRIGPSNPTSSLDDGDLFFNTTSNKMLVYNASDSSWDDVQSVGNYFINTLSSLGASNDTIPGGSATPNGVAKKFTLSNAGTYAQQHLVSINGVIQKPNSGTSVPSEGFAIDGSAIIFSDAPPTGSDYFIVTIGAAVNIGTPGNNTVSTATIQNLAVTTDKIANDSITGDKVANNLDISDSNKIRFGDSSDLQIHHTGDHSYIEDVGAGSLYIDSNQLYLRNNDTSNVLLYTTSGGAVRINHNGTTKLETTSTGLTVTGNVDSTGSITVDDGEKFVAGDSNDLQIYHTGGDNRIENHGANLYLRTGASGSETSAVFASDGAVKLYYDNALKLETTSSGATVTGTLTASGTGGGAAALGSHLDLGDSQKVRLGSSDDLQIYHDPTTTRNKIECHNGELRIDKGASSETLARFIPDGAVELFHNDSKKFETASNGCYFDGHVMPGSNGGYDLGLNATRWGDVYIRDSKRIKLGDSNDLEIYHNGTHSYIWNTQGDLQIRSNAMILLSSSGETYLQGDVNGTTSLWYDNVKKFETLSSGAKVWGDFHCTNSIHVPDGEFLRLGDSQELKIWHDGNTHSYITESGGGGLAIGGSMVSLMNLATTEYMFHGSENAESAMYYDGTKRFETTVGGAKITGNGMVTGDFLVDSDTGKLKLGLGEDLQLYHESGNSYIRNATGVTYIRGNDLRLETYAGERYLDCTENNTVALYYDDSKKFQTGSEGIFVYGAEGADATIRLFADEGDDNADLWKINAAAAGGFFLENYTSGAWETNIKASGNGSVDLYYNNAKRFFTEDSGASVCGTGATVHLILRDQSDNIRGRLHGGVDEFGWLNIAGNAWTYRIENDGDYQHYGSSISDRDLKDNITTVTGTALDKVTKLVPKTYSWKQTPDGLTPTHKTFTGFIAQEVKEQIPSLVTGTDGQKNMALDYTGLLAHAIKAITELKAEVDTLKTKVAALEAA